MILTAAAIERARAAGELAIDPFDPAALNANTYNLHLDATVLRSDGTKWLNGAVSVAASLFCTVAAGVVTLGNDVAGGFDDVVFLSYLVPTDWPAQIFAFGAAL